MIKAVAQAVLAYAMSVLRFQWGSVMTFKEILLVFGGARRKTRKAFPGQDGRK